MGPGHDRQFAENILTMLARSSVVTALLVVGSLSACLEESVKPLRLGTNLWAGYEPLYLARDLGYIEKNKVRLVEYVSASEVIRGFRNGNIDAAALTLDEALLLRESGIQIKIILVTDISDGGDALLGRREIKKFGDVAGKRVGVESTALGAYVLIRALELNGLSLGDVDVEYLEANEHEAAFTDGRVDAVVTFDPVRTRLLRKGATELFTSREIPGEIVDILVVREEQLTIHQEQLAHLIDGWFRALQYLEESPDDAAKRLDFRLKVGPEQVLDIYGGLRLPSRAENIRLLTGSSPELATVAERLSEVMISNNLLASHVPVGGLFKVNLPILSPN